jgi:hypothetical protein
MSDLKQSPAAFLQGRNGDQTKEPVLNQEIHRASLPAVLLRRALMTVGRE